jgi:hypothetical protein
MTPCRLGHAALSFLIVRGPLKRAKIVLASAGFPTPQS